MNTKKLDLSNVSFETKIILNSFLPDIISGFVIFAYSAIATQLSLNYIIPAIKYIILMIIIFQFLIAPIIDHLVYKDISKRVQDFYKNKLNIKERTKLLDDLCSLPEVCAVMTVIYFVIGSLILFLIYHFSMKMALSVNILSFCECVFGSYLSGILAYNYCRRVCTEDSYNIVKAGVDKDYVMDKKILGTRISMQIFTFIAIPIIFAGLISIYVIIAGYFPFKSPELWPTKDIQMRRMIMTSALNFISQVVLVILFVYHVFFSNKKMMEALEDMEKGNITTSPLLKTDIRDDIAYNHYLTNELLLYFRRILSGAAEIGNTVDESSKELLKISSETQSTALEQSSGTNEIVSTMEDTNRLSNEIEVKISEVADVAEQTVANVKDGSKILTENLAKMSQIAESNEKTITGIRQLNEKVTNIWEIVNIINNIADQTKIIAFNAELEATSVRARERNFKNVANEIRRLANGTMDSTKEIKERINDIQVSAEELLHSSETYTDQINHGMTLARSLETSFSNISSSAQKNATAAVEIKKRITQETEAFEQIVTTLQQISKSIESFSSSTKSIIDTSSILQKKSQELASISKNEAGERA